MSNDGLSVVSGLTNGKIVVCCIADGTVAKEIDAHEGYVYSISFSNDGLFMASGGQDKVCRVMNTKTWEILKEI